jgi:hypothetical protein
MPVYLKINKEQTMAPSFMKRAYPDFGIDIAILHFIYI